jgi:iron(III) transport system substrate-binding protein
MAAAYNVVGSYAQARAARHANIKVVYLEDYTNILLRTAFISRRSQKSRQAGEFLNFLLSRKGQLILEGQGGLPSVFNSSIVEITNAKPIGLNTGLLVYLDRLKRENFLREWNAALVQ